VNLIALGHVALGPAVGSALTDCVNYRRVRRPRCLAMCLLAAATLGLLLVSACSSSPRMMGGKGAVSPGSGGMMNGGGAAMPGYHYSPTTCAAPSLTATTVQVVVADMGLTTMMGGTAPMGAHMMLRSAPSSIASGQITFLAINRGWRTHELVILPLASGAAAGQRVAGPDGKVTETGSLGEASTPCGAGAGSGIPAGSASWVTLTVPAGRYELLCNLPNHYADGMYQEFEVA
jgi:uncharacterized cupredoxin-like copper-binding protein